MYMICLSIGNMNRWGAGKGKTLQKNWGFSLYLPLWRKFSLDRRSRFGVKLLLVVPNPKSENA